MNMGNRRRRGKKALNLSFFSFLTWTHASVDHVPQSQGSEFWGTRLIGFCVAFGRAEIWNHYHSFCLKNPYHHVMVNSEERRISATCKVLYRTYMQLVSVTKILACESLPHNRESSKFLKYNDGN